MTGNILGSRSAIPIVTRGANLLDNTKRFLSWGFSVYAFPVEMGWRRVGAFRFLFDEYTIMPFGVFVLRCLVDGVLRQIRR